MVMIKRGEEDKQWSWVMESLADMKQVDTALLEELVAVIPNGYDSLSNNARERIALRRLEDLILNTPNPHPVTHPAQYVYCQLLNKKMVASSSSMSALDSTNSTVPLYVLQKRACLPKCALLELAESLINGSPPLAASLGMASGLTREREEERGRELDQSQTPQSDSTHSAPESPVENHHNVEPPDSALFNDGEMQNVDGDSLVTGCSHYDYCIRCKESGQLLLCFRRACRTALHESCLGAEASFDDMGNFFCPPCSYLEALVACDKLEKEAELAKEAAELAPDWLKKCMIR